MRSKDRIDAFVAALEEIWINYFPDWRFGQLMSNFLGWVQSEKQRDFFFCEEPEMMGYLKEYARLFSVYKKD